jgi:hypothetical protein
VLVQVSNAIWMQIFVSVLGIALLSAVAWYRSWSKRMDRAPKPVASASAPQAAS